MKQIYVNLKRFDIPAGKGGICPQADPVGWIEDTLRQSLEAGLDRLPDVRVTYFLPESLLVPALSLLRALGGGGLGIGCQGVYRRDVSRGGDFGAFTGNRPAKAMGALGCEWTLVGHSEERLDKLELLSRYDGAIPGKAEAYQAAADTVDQVLNQEVLCALEEGMNVVFCIGETAQQKGSDTYAEYAPRVRRVIEQQITHGLKGLVEHRGACTVALGYEPIWAIGPGKQPPDAQYIAFVSRYAKQVCREAFGFELPVVYGGGLKEANASEIAGVQSIDGGLVALTKFTPPIGFDVDSLKNIILAYTRPL